MSDKPLEWQRPYIEANEERGWESWSGKFADVDRIPNTAIITGYFDGFKHHTFDPPIQCSDKSDLAMEFFKRVKPLRQARP